jgi:hypothetical protein
LLELFTGNLKESESYYFKLIKKAANLPIEDKTTTLRPLCLKNLRFYVFVKGRFKSIFKERLTWQRRQENQRAVRNEKMSGKMSE